MMEVQTHSSTTTPPVREKLKDVEAQVEEGDEEAKKQRDAQKTLISRVIQGVAVGCIVLNILAMALSSGTVVIVAGIVGIVVGGGVIFFQQELQNEDCK
jgi:F0F1-type ATP synthase assembly protein I